VSRPWLVCALLKRWLAVYGFIGQLVTPWSPPFHSPCLACPLPQVYVRYDPTLTRPHAFPTLQASGATHTMAHITPSRILRTSPCFIHIFQLFNDSPPPQGLKSDRYQISIRWYFSHQRCLYVGLRPYCTIYGRIDTRTVPSTMLVYGLRYGSWLISYRITPVVYGRMPLRYGAQPYPFCYRSRVQKSGDGP